jgi:hypothetical protein
MPGRTIAAWASLLVLALAPAMVLRVDAAVVLAVSAVICLAARRLLVRPVPATTTVTNAESRHDARTPAPIRLSDPDAPGRPRPRAPGQGPPSRV